MVARQHRLIIRAPYATWGFLSHVGCRSNNWLRNTLMSPMEMDHSNACGPVPGVTQVPCPGYSCCL